MSASDIMSGDLLPKLASENVGVFHELSRFRQFASARVLTWASVCSGLGGDKLV